MWMEKVSSKLSGDICKPISTPLFSSRAFSHLTSLDENYQIGMMTSLDINANPGEREEDEVEMTSMKTATRRRSKNSSEYDDFGLIEVQTL